MAGQISRGRSVGPPDNLKLVEQNLPILLTIRALFVSYARRFNSIPVLMVCSAFSNLILELRSNE